MILPVGLLCQRREEGDLLRQKATPLVVLSRMWCGSKKKLYVYGERANLSRVMAIYSDDDV